ncbi:MAG TPA: hypothetical protein VGJ41_08050, partial [Nocardioides sp.]
MRASRNLGALLIGLLTAGSIVLPTAPTSGALAVAAPERSQTRVQFEHWPQEQGKQLSKVVGRFADRGEYAVFDADNTIWRYDLEESLLPFLEMKGVLT